MIEREREVCRLTEPFTDDQLGFRPRAADVEVVKDWNFKRGRRAFHALRPHSLGDDVQTHTAKELRSFLLHSPALRTLHVLLPPPRRHLLLLPRSTRLLPLPTRSLPPLPPVSAESSSRLLSSPTQRDSRAQFLQDSR